jgi:hypothetical protein
VADARYSRTEGTREQLWRVESHGLRWANRPPQGFSNPHQVTKPPGVKTLSQPGSSASHRAATPQAMAMPAMPNTTHQALGKRGQAPLGQRWLLASAAALAGQH